MTLPFTSILLSPYTLLILLVIIEPLIDTLELDTIFSSLSKNYRKAVFPEPMSPTTHTNYPLYICNSSIINLNGYA